MNGLIYLEPEDVLEIHDAYIDMFGGIKGIRDEGLFSQLCEAPYQEFDDVELFPTVFDKAAKYLANDEISFDDIVQSIKEHSVNGWHAFYFFPS